MSRITTRNGWKSVLAAASIAAICGLTSFTAVAAAAQAGPYTGKVRGVFDRSCRTCLSDQGGQLERRLVTANVWCAWQDGHVIVHATMHNGSVEHITVNWNPVYWIRDGGEHGQGFGSQQSNGFDAGETRSFYVKQDPKGVPDSARLALCRPAFWDIKSG